MFTALLKSLGPFAIAVAVVTYLSTGSLDGVGVAVRGISVDGGSPTAPPRRA